MTIVLFCLCCYVSYDECFFFKSKIDFALFFKELLCSKGCAVSIVILLVLLWKELESHICQICVSASKRKMMIAGSKHSVQYWSHYFLIPNWFTVSLPHYGAARRDCVVAVVLSFWAWRTVWRNPRFYTLQFTRHWISLMRWNREEPNQREGIGVQISTSVNPGLSFNYICVVCMSG